MCFLLLFAFEALSGRVESSDLPSYWPVQEDFVGSSSGKARGLEISS